MPCQEVTRGVNWCQRSHGDRMKKRLALQSGHFWPALHATGRRHSPARRQLIERAPLTILSVYLAAVSTCCAFARRVAWFDDISCPIASSPVLACRSGV